MSEEINNMTSRWGGGLRDFMGDSMGTLAVLAALQCTFAADARAQTDAVAAFYRGRTVQAVVGYTPGSTFELYLRTITRHLGRHIPGNPTIVVQNIPSRIAAANMMFSTAMKDGTTIALLQRGILLAKLIYPCLLYTSPSPRD